jgi:outer membrane protein assembly factor BamB
MTKLAAVVMVGGLAVGSAWAQSPREWANPVVPSQQALDRLNLRLGWQAAMPVEGFRDGIATVQNLGDLIIVQTRHGGVVALDPATGAARWRASVGLAYPVTHRVGYNDTTILVDNGTRVFGLDRSNGKQLWEVDLAGTPSSPPTADANAFYVCLGNGRLSAYALPRETAAVAGAPPAAPSGAGRPMEPAGSPSSGIAAAAGSGAVRTPPVPARPSAAGFVPKTTQPTGAPASVAGGRTVTVSTALQATGGRSVTTAVQATGGRTATGGGDINRTIRGGGGTAGAAPQLLWDYQTTLRISERPVFSEKQVLVIGTGREALFIDKTGQNPLVVNADAAFTAPLGQYGDMVYAGCANGSVYAFDMRARATQWQVTLDGEVTERPTPTDDDLFVTAGRGGVYRLDRATGQTLWHNPAGVRFVATNPKFVYARDEAGRLLILDKARGTTLTTLDLRDFSTNLSNADSDRLIVAANDGMVISLHDRAYAQPLHLRNPPPPPAETEVTQPRTPAATAPAPPRVAPAPPKPQTPVAPKPPAPGTPAKPPDE